LIVDHRPNVSSITDQQQKKLFGAIAYYENRHPIEVPDTVAKEVEYIEQLMGEYIAGGRRRVWDTRKRGSRGALLREVLEEFEQPTHYTLVHKKAMERVPDELQFPKERAYSTMFYSDQFRLYGEGVFGLASWDITQVSALGEEVFQHCPTPILPSNAHPNAFFDSVMLGRELLSKQPLTAEKFWLEMQAWAQKNGATVQDAQDAFDAWYTVGLVERIDFVWQKYASLTLTLPTDAKLGEVREYCLNMLCQRVLKMPELLLTLIRVARPTTSLIQKILFGSEKAGFDVPTRLTMLSSFGAVQQMGDEWRLTDIGRAALEANPPQELPDFSEVEMVEEDDDIEAQIEWEYDDLGLLDL
jgi:hypothetical protein